jgi:tetratricopeptide (TPR) repeat protein
MKKEEKGSRTTNIVSFPYLKERLIEKGLDLINHQRYEEASDLLLQAYKENELSEEILMALMLSLYESRQYEVAQEIYESISSPTIEQTELYLLSLIQLSNHEKVIKTIQSLMNNIKITEEKQEHYKKLMQFSQRQWDIFKSKKLVKEDSTYDEEDDKREEHFSGKSIQEQMSFIGSIRLHRLKPYENELVQAVANSETNPFIQTLILELLREHEFDKDIELNKMNKKEIVNPFQLHSVFEVPYYITLEKELDRLFGHQDPIQLQQVIEIAKRHAFLWYPISPNVEPLILAKAYQALLHTYYDPSFDLIGHNESNHELKKAINLLREWERLSETINL